MIIKLQLIVEPAELNVDSSYVIIIDETMKDIQDEVIAFTKLKLQQVNTLVRERSRYE